MWLKLVACLAFSFVEGVVSNQNDEVDETNWMCKADDIECIANGFHADAFGAICWLVRLFSLPAHIIRLGIGFVLG